MAADNLAQDAARQEIEEIKDLVRDVMARDFDLIPTPSGKGGRVHLAVWENRRTHLPIGLEMGHSGLVNFWLTRADLPATLPAGILRTDKEPDDDGWTDEEGAGANHNLIHYRQFSGRPMTRLGVRHLADATAILAQLTRGDVAALAERAARSRRGAAFLLKINGASDAPGGICRPVQAADWEGGTLSMPQNGKAPSTGHDGSPGPGVVPGDRLYIWTHEDENHGHGTGLTATAIAGETRVLDDRTDIVLEKVELLPHPIGFGALDEAAMGLPPLLRAMDRFRHTRCWLMSPEDRAGIDVLIAGRGDLVAREEAAATEAYVEPLERAIGENRDEIRAAEEERKTAIVKARPGQQRFREEVMRRHGGRCVITGFSVAAVLDAAHVIPHTGAPEFEVPENGLLLRRDIHALFDACLIAIHPVSGKVLVSRELEGTKYATSLAGRRVEHKLAPASLRYQHARFTASEKSGSLAG